MSKKLPACEDREHRSPEGTVDPIDKSALATRKKECDECVVEWTERPCVSLADEKWWAQVLVHAHDVGKEIEEDKERLKRPILDDGKRIDAAFKSAQSSVKSLKDLAQKKLAGPAQARFEAEAEAHRLAQAAGVLGDAVAAHEALAAAPQHTKVEGASVRRRWGFNVVDEKLVPRAYLQVDGSAITQFMKDAVSAEQTPVMLGVEFYQETVVQPTGKRKT